jgi:HK97 family phage prohead protease
MEKREFKSSPSFIKAVEDRIVTQVFSVTGVLDMYRDRVMKGAFKKTLAERRDQIRVLWQHNFRDPPIGVLISAEEIGKEDLPDEVREKYPEATGALEAVVEYLETQRGDEALVGIEKKAIRENSIGFDTIQQKIVKEEVSDDVTITIRQLTEIRLWDLSPVNWGANPATFNRTALLFKSTGATRNGSWKNPQLGDFIDSPAEWLVLEKPETERIAMHYAMAEFPVVDFNQLEFPHHLPRYQGVGPAHWDGVTAAMGKLMQTAAQVDDKEGVHDHLARHYLSDFGENPPDLKLFELAHAVQTALSMDEPDLQGCYEAVEALNAKLTEAGPRMAMMPVRTHFEHELLKAKALKHYVDSL